MSFSDGKESAVRKRMAFKRNRNGDLVWVPHGGWQYTGERLDLLSVPADLSSFSESQRHALQAWRKVADNNPDKVPYCMYQPKNRTEMMAVIMSRDLYVTYFLTKPMKG